MKDVVEFWVKQLKFVFNIYLELNYMLGSIINFVEANFSFLK